MAKNEALDKAEKIQMLRQMAFHIHRKREPAEVLGEFLDEQFRLGRRREFRPAADAMNAGGFAEAMQALGMVGDEGALLLGVILDGKDHRLMAAALNALADRIEG